MKDNHKRRWGVIYLLAALFVASWVGQFVAQIAEGDGWTLFLASTLENWQSEFLQLLVQAGVVVGAAHKVFSKSTEDMDQVKAEIRELRDDLRR